MKKSMILCASLCAAFMLSSCGSSKESAYKRAYEKAKSQEQTADDSAAPVVAPVEESPATQVTVEESVENASVRQENVTVVSGSGLNDYSVVVGSFSLKTNAEGLYNKLKSEGHDARLAYNADRNMYRVVAASFTSKGIPCYLSRRLVAI